MFINKNNLFLSKENDLIDISCIDQMNKSTYYMLKSISHQGVTNGSSTDEICQS